MFYCYATPSPFLRDQVCLCSVNNVVLQTVHTLYREAYYIVIYRKHNGLLMKVVENPS